MRLTRIFACFAAISLLAVPLLVVPQPASRVQQLIADGELRGALNILNGWTADLGGEEQVAVDTIELNLQLGHVDEARQLLERLVIDQPHLEWPRLRLAEIIETTGTLEQRLNAAAARFHENPNAADLRQLVGHARLRGDLQEEARWLEHGFVEGLIQLRDRERLGLLAAAQRKRNEAIEHLLAAVKGRSDAGLPARLTLFRLMIDADRAVEAVDVAISSGLDLSDANLRLVYASQIVGLGQHGLGALLLVRRMNMSAP